MKSLYKVFVPPGITEDIEKILSSGQFTSGHYLSLLEKALTQFIGGNTLNLVSNYNAAASIVWELIGLNEGDEVIASPMSCLASNQPLAVKRAKVKWTDIDPFVGSLDPDLVRKNISSKTKAILHYHWGGFPGHIEEVLNIGREFGIPVVEDGIESFGAMYKGKYIGNTGADFSIFSFQPVRLPTTIDGGGIICKRPEDQQKVTLLRDYGIDRSKFRNELGEISEACDIAIPAFGAAMSEVNALIGYKTMSYLPDLLEKQRTNAKSNRELMSSFEGTLEVGLNETLPNYWVHSFLVKDRNTLLRKLRDKGLYASQVHLRNDHYSVFGEFDASLKGVKKFNSETLSIPSGWWL